MEGETLENSPRHAIRTNNYGRAILIFTILIFISVLLFIGASLWQNGTIRNIIQLFKFRDSYQAIFLNSGQVYFGNITEITEKYIILKDPYSIKVQQKQLEGENQTTQQEVKLVSIKDEFHKPKNYMLIEKSGVNYIEELEDYSYIIDIIQNYKKQ